MVLSQYLIDSLGDRKRMDTVVRIEVIVLASIHC
jgi:hypothetical protein